MKLDVKTLFKIITTPTCWIRNYKTSKVWDEKLNTLLDEEDFILDWTGCTIYFPKSEITVWVENYPYASGDLFSSNKPHYSYIYKGLPKRKTVFRLKEKVIQKALNMGKGVTDERKT